MDQVTATSRDVKCWNLRHWTSWQLHVERLVSNLALPEKIQGRIPVCWASSGSEGVKLILTVKVIYVTKIHRPVSIPSCALCWVFLGQLELKYSVDLVSIARHKVQVIFLTFINYNGFYPFTNKNTWPIPQISQFKNNKSALIRYIPSPIAPPSHFSP